MEKQIGADGASQGDRLPLAGAIIDHSIDIGTKKALVVLRVKLDALSKRGGAIRLEDCECIGLRIGERVNGEQAFFNENESQKAGNVQLE